MIGRAFRLVRALSPKFAHPDDIWAQKILSAPEFSVFARMDARDREHAIRITQKLVTLYPNASLTVQRAALLHDCGKLVRPYNVLERVFVGLFYVVKDSGGNQPKFVTFSAANVKRFHPQTGAALILEAGGDARVAEIVRKHHNPGDDLEARMVHEVDELE